MRWEVCVFVLRKIDVSANSVDVAQAWQPYYRHLGFCQKDWGIKVLPQQSKMNDVQGKFV